MESALTTEESEEAWTSAGRSNATWPPLPPPEPCGVWEAHAPGIAVALSVLYGAVFLLALAGNLLVLGIVYARPKLRSASNVNLINLALADLASLVGLPFALVGELKAAWIFGDLPCVLLAFLSLWASTATVLILLHISVYRYFVVARARGRVVKLLRRRTVRINALVWPVAALLCCPPVLGWGRYRHCVGLPGCFLDLPASRSFVVFLALSTTVLPSALMVFCYARICATVRDSSRRVKGTAQALFRASAVLAEGVVGETRRSRCSLREVEFLALPSRSPHHHLHRASDPGILPAARPDKRLSVVSYTSVIASMRPEELRLGRSLVLVSVAYALFWLPAVGAMLAVAFLGERGPIVASSSPSSSSSSSSARSVRGLWLAMQLCLYAHAAVNPFVYGLLTDPFRSALSSAVGGGRAKTRPGLRAAGAGEAKRPSLALDRLHAVESDTYLDRSNSDSRTCERINLKRLSVPESGRHHRLSL